MNKMLATRELEQYIHSIYERIMTIAQTDGIYKPLDNFFSNGTPRGCDGSFCYSDDDGYHYGINERGQLVTEFETQNLVEIVFKVISSDILWMAHDYEKKHRIEGEDSRRQLFRKIRQYWGIIGEDYTDMAEKDIADTLAKAPFVD